MSGLNLANLFTAADLTDAINIVPNMYGRLQELNLLPPKGVATQTILIEEQNGSLALLPTEGLQPKAGPGTVGKKGKRTVRSFVIPRIVHEDAVFARDVEAVRAFGTNEMMQVQTLVNQVLTTARNKHDLTLEWLRWGALKGSILDADGSTEIYNLYTEFGITEKSVDFLLGSADTDVRGKCMEVVRHIEDNLLGDRMSGIRAEVSQEFMDKLTKHANVKAAFANYMKAADMLGGDVRKDFDFGGITWTEQRGQATGTDGVAKRFVAAGDGRAFPMGTGETFKTYVGPADFIETVNQLGQIYYAKMEVQKFGRGWDIHTQSNVLPMCMRPAVSVKLTTSN